MKIFIAKTAALIMIFPLFISCGKSKQKEMQKTIQETSAKHSWYYFANENFYKTENLSSVPAVSFKPWTEATRISAASVQNSDGTEIPKGFAIVNRAGILCFSGKNINFVQDKEIFANSTAGNLVFFDETPIFSVYKSTFFNNQKIPTNAMHTFLVQLNTEQNICYPILTVENLGVPQTSEITDFTWDGQFWTCSVKDSGNGAEKIKFSYLTFQPKETLTSISPANANNSIFVTQTSVENFRKAMEVQNFSKAPERIKQLLASLSNSIQFVVTVHTAGGHSPRKFLHGNNLQESEKITSYAILSDTWAACLFSDGTLFMNGALFENRILKHGKTIGIKLPKLPAGFSYGNFLISGTNLYAAWEETSFFKTARSGFICVDLNEILYKNE